MRVAILVNIKITMIILSILV